LTADAIVLRPPGEADVETLIEVCSDPEIVRFTRVPSPYARSDAEAFVAAARRGSASGDSHLLVIADKASDMLLGTISLSIHRLGVGEIGYWCDERRADAASQPRQRGC
jgi:RimJ/RimL family protein N-acetyltransferase